jgi:hypothetical protein
MTCLVRFDGAVLACLYLWRIGSFFRVVFSYWGTTGGFWLGYNEMSSRHLEPALRRR